MTKQRLARIRKRLASLRGSEQRYRVLETIAQQLGRKAISGGDHGKFWVNDNFPNLQHFAIPRHSKPCGKGIVNYIAGILETQDIEAWEEFIENPRENDDAWE